MKTNTLLVCSSLVASLLSLFSARESWACSAQCYEGEFLPSKSAVPASIPAIFWNARTGGVLPAPFDVTLFRVTEMGYEPVPFTGMQFNNSLNQFVLVPDEPLLPNSDYELRDAASCIPGDMPIQTTFHTLDALPFPKTLGTILVKTPFSSAIDLASIDGGCSSRIMTLNSRVELVPTAEALPFYYAFLFETLVDGEVWAPMHQITQIIPVGESWEGRGQDLLYTTCGFEPPSGVGSPLSEGEHSVVFRAKLAGSDFSIESEPATVVLKCDDIPVPPASVVIESEGCQMNAGGFGYAYRGWMTISLAMAAIVAWRRRSVRA